MVSDGTITGVGISDHARQFFVNASNATKSLLLDTRFPTLGSLVDTVHYELTSAKPVEGVPLFALSGFNFPVSEVSLSESFTPGGNGISGGPRGIA